MKNFSVIKKRIRLFLNEKNISYREVYNNCDIADGTLSNDSALGEENILKFFSFYKKEISSIWLLTGEGEMINKNNDEIEKSSQLQKNTEQKRIIELQNKLLDYQTQIIELEREIKKYLKKGDTIKPAKLNIKNK